MSHHSIISSSFPGDWIGITVESLTSGAYVRIESNTNNKKSACTWCNLVYLEENKKASKRFFQQRLDGRPRVAIPSSKL